MRAVCMGACMALLVLVHQVKAQGIEPYVEYRKRVEATQGISPLDSGLFGEQVSLYNGSTVFTVTDIDVPGNSALPLRLSRRHSVEIRPQPDDNSLLGGIANWDVEVPYMAATYPQSSGWYAQRCSIGSLPSLIDGPFYRFEYWHGITVHIPGRGSTNALGLQAQVPRPSDGTPYRLTTTDRDAFSCIPMKSGLAGEGFRMTTTSGLRYYFDVGATRTAAMLEKQVWDSFVGFYSPVSMSRLRYYLLASKIEDAFGNTVQFQYSASGQPTRIWANDGREILLAYTNGRLSTATSHGRTWQYQYTPIGAGLHGLSAVIQPDGSQWQYAYSDNLKPPPDPNGIPFLPWCAGLPSLLDTSYVLTAMHPSGALGTFTFNNQRHTRSGVHATECMKEGSGISATYTLIVPHYYDVMSLTSKVIAGPGMPTMAWNYDYGFNLEMLWGVHNQPLPYPCTTCTPHKTVTVTNPDSTKSRYRFGMVYMLNDGRQLQVERLRADDTVISTEVNEYLPDSAVSSQPFHGEYGSILGGLSDPLTARVRPVVQRVIVQDGATFRWQVNAFDAFARPTSVTKSSTVP